LETPQDGRGVDKCRQRGSRGGTPSFQFLATPPLKALHAGRLSFVKIIVCFVFTLYVYMIL